GLQLRLAQIEKKIGSEGQDPAALRLARLQLGHLCLEAAHLRGEPVVQVPIPLDLLRPRLRAVALLLGSLESRLERLVLVGALVLGQGPGEPGADLGLLRKATRLQVVSPGERMLRGSELGLRCSELLRGVFGNRTGLRQRRAGRGKLGGRRGLGSARRQYGQERERSHIRTDGRHISYPELPGLKNGVAENGSRRRNSRDRNLQHATT